MNTAFGRWVLVAVVVAAGVVHAAGQPASLSPLPNGRELYVDHERRITFEMPADYRFDVRPPPLGEPPYQVAFESSNQKIEVRLNVEDMTSTGTDNVATPQRLSLWATTYAMNRFARRHPKDVQLLHDIPPTHASALFSVVGELPPGSSHKAEKSVFLAVPPNRIYVITMLFDEGDLQGALQLAEILPTTIELLPSPSPAP